MKKQLLKESEVRKLMKFANIGALSDEFVSRLDETSMIGEQEDEDLIPDEGEEGGDLPGEELSMDADADAAADDEEAVDADAAVADVGAEEEAPATPEEAVADFVDDIDLFMHKVAGTPRGTVSTDRSANADAAPDAALVDGEAENVEPLETSPVDDVPPALGAEEEEVDPDAPPKNEATELEEEELVNEVARRVAKRLQNLRRKR